MSWIQEKYLSLISSTLPMFKKKKHGLYNCRCIECGDSEKSKLKARGYFYTKDNELFYSCHNCGSSKRFDTFLKEYYPDTYKEYKLELFKENFSPKTKESEIIYKNKKVVFKKDVLQYAIRVDSLDDDHIAIKYLKNRMIPTEKYSELYYIDKLENLTKNIDKYANTKYDNVPRLLIPSYNINNELTHISCRALEKSNLRYITLTLIDEVKAYGLNKLDYSKTIYITEGQFDSMFLTNSIAMAGSDLDAKFLGDNVVYVMDNEPRSKQITSKMEKLISKGYSLVIWGKIKGKDINEMILNGMTKEKVFEHIKENTYSGIRARMKLTQYRIGK
jgi:hypothetical protein